MARLLGRFLLVLLLVLPSTVMFAGNDGHGSNLAFADTTVEDAVDGEDSEETTVESEGDQGSTESTESTLQPTEPVEEKEEEKTVKASPDGDTKLVFIKPTIMEFPAGSLVKLLIGFTNKGEKDFIIDSVDASFRYPQDFTYFIQNFTAVQYNTLVQPKKQQTFEYSFTPSDQFPARPFGLNINLHYKDSEGTIFHDAVFNDTVNIVELDEGLDGETFFLYVLMAALVVLILVGLQQLLASFSKKRLSLPKKAVVEMGTQNNTDIDYDWIPAEALNTLKTSSRSSRSPKQSPRQRRSKRTTGSDE